jgi:hypothetical protein
MRAARPGHAAWTDELRESLIRGASLIVEGQAVGYRSTWCFCSPCTFWRWPSAP